MTKSNLHIEIAYTIDKKFSSMKLSSREMIKAVLEEHYGEVGLSLVNNLSDLKALVAKKPDLVILGLKRLPQTGKSFYEVENDIWMSAYLDSKGINYTGSTQQAIKLEFNKERAKIRVHISDLPTAPFFTALKGQFEETADLPVKFPLFIKPLDSGSGRGIDSKSVVHNFKEFQEKVDSISTKFETVAIVEKYLSGREFSVAILENSITGEDLVMPVELIAEENHNGDRILGSQVKTDDNEHVIAVSDSRLKTEISILAKNIFKALGARDFGRIDIRMDDKGSLYFLEANLIPGLSGGYFTRACMINAGLSYEDVILSVVNPGILRGIVPQATGLAVLSN